MTRTRNGLNRLLSRYQEAERRLESVADEMEQLEKKLAALPPGPLADELREELQQLTERMSGEAEAIAQLGRSPLPYDLDQKLSKNLHHLADQLGELADKVGDLARSPSASKSQVGEELERLRKQLAGDKDELATETGPPLEWLTAVYPLLEDEARFTDLYQRQRDLAERLSALRGRDRQDDPSLKARMRDLEAEQQRLQTELTELLDDIDEHAKRLPKKPEFKELRLSAELFAMLVKRSEAEPTMIQAAVALSQFAGTEGHDQAVRAADILESFLAKCQGIGEQGTASLKNSFEPGLGESLGSTLSQLLADSGFGQEGGLGAGRGGGYSARRNSLGNIGLYGGFPATSGMQGGQQRGANSSRGTPGYAKGSQAAAGGAGANVSTGNATTGGAEASVPSEYRRRVGRYFQRLADELGSAAER
jgi:hypothetical protein